MVKRTKSNAKELITHALDKEEDTTIIRVLNVLEKYQPLIQQFVNGISQAAQSRTMQPQQVAYHQQVRSRIPPPPGWVEMDRLKRHGRKYSHPEWYAQGIAYEEQIEQAPSPQVVYVPQPAPQAPPQPVYAEPPLVKDAPSEKLVQELEAQPMTPPAQQPPAPINYIDMSLAHVQNMPIKEFKDTIDNLDLLKEKTLKALPLLPDTAIEQAAAVSLAGLYEHFKEHLPEQYAAVGKKKKHDELRKLLEEVQVSAQEEYRRRKGA